MAIVPDKKLEKIAFFETRNAQWTANAVAMGSSAADVTSVRTKAAAARSAYQAQQIALAAAKDATNLLNNAIDAMGIAGAGVIKQVKAKAETTANPDVYVLAGLPVPTPPQPRKDPGKPYDFTVELNELGGVELGWKATNPAGGTIYQVHRSVNGSNGPFTYIGGSGERKITDGTIPPGTTRLTYQVQGVRSNAVGPWGSVNVGFGTGLIEPTTNAAGVKLAA